MITLVAYSPKVGVYQWSVGGEDALDTAISILDAPGISWLVIYP